MNNFILKQLYEENQNNNLVIFIGSGISKYYSNSPEEFPDWEKLINEFKERLNIDFNKNKDYLRIAQIFEDKYNRSELLNLVESMFPGYVKPGKLHEKLIEEVKPAHIITTNYDDLIESVEKASVLRYKVLRTDKDFPSSSKHSNFIVKAHGDLKQKNIVLTEKDYLNYHKNFPLFLSFLRYVFSKYRVLFIGFSLTDPNFIKILEDVKDVLGDSSIKHVAIMHDPISEEEKLYFDKKSIIIVTKDEVEKFLNLKEKDDTKYLIEYFEFLYKGFTKTKPLDIIQFLERILDIGFLYSFDFLYKDILKDVWNEQGITIVDDIYPWKIESISTEGTKVSLYDILNIISEEENVDCAMVKLLEKSGIKPNEDNISKLKKLIINVLSLLLKSNVTCIGDISDEYYIPEIIQKLKGLKEQSRERPKKEITEVLNKELDEAFKFLTYTPEISRMDDNSIKVYIKDYKDNSLKIDGPLWKEIFEEDDFYSKYLRGKANEALLELLQNMNNKGLSQEERFLLLYRLRHICRITGYRKKECLLITKEIKNILENSDKKTHSIISYLNQERFVSSFQEFVDFKEIALENNSNKDDELKDEFYVEYSSVLKFIISNKLPVFHYLKIRYLIKFVIEYFFKEVYSNQNNDVFEIPEWFVMGILFLNFESFTNLISSYYNTWGNVEKVKLSESTKVYLRKTLEKLLEKEIGFSKNYRVIYPENLVLLLLLFSTEEKDIELFVRYWKKYILAVQSYGITSNNLFGVFGSLMKSIKSNKNNVNKILADYISKYKILDNYVEIFLSKAGMNFLDYLVENLEILASKKIEVLCNNKLINKLEDFLSKKFENSSEQLTVLKFM